MTFWEVIAELIWEMAIAQAYNEPVMPHTDTSDDAE